jgi:uncharacterized protein YukE
MVVKEIDMNEQQNVPPEGGQPGGPGKNDSWAEVGRQFQELGDSLAQAVRETWQDEETQKRLREVRSGLESMAQEVGKAIDETAHSPQGQRVRESAGRTAETMRGATEQTMQEIRPHLISALEELNRQLQKLIERITQGRNPPGAPPTQPPDPGSGSGPAY